MPYVPPPPKPFTAADDDCANQKRDRYTRSQWGRQLLDIAEGRVTVTKEQFQALIAYGRFKGWNRRAPDKKLGPNRFVR